MLFSSEISLKSTLFKSSCFFLVLFLPGISTLAQHHGHGKADTSAQHHADTVDHSMHQMSDSVSAMSHAFSLNLPMNRNGSGTAWLPDASPMYGVMLHSKKWMYMLHGNLALRYTKQDLGDNGTRGGDQFDAPNWLMGMGQRRAGKNGLFRFSAMLSLDRLTEGGDGYPLLFQTGESWQGEPLVDRQHPHDLFSELSVAYTHAFSKQADLSVYLGYPGEPALGSVAFMHRPSALAGPDAPISHHWNDGTHITFGVATLGFRYGKVKVEASSFTGREPDENRYDFDKPRFDSWSGRISYNPSANWAMQVSQGWINSPELLHPGEDVNRTVASVIHSLPFGEEKSVNTTALWALNKRKDHGGEHAALLETTLRLNKLALYGRYEWVQKSAEELNLDESIFDERTLFPVHAVTAGLNQDIFRFRKLRLAAGGQLSWYSADGRLDDLYGDNPFSGQLFIRLYPSLMNMKM